jgi:hypothetical protein
LLYQNETIITIKKTEIMPIELLYTDSEIVKMHRNLLFKKVISKEELELLEEIQNYMKRPA